MTVIKQLENILDSYPYLRAMFGSVQEREAVLRLMGEAYDLGKSSKKCKEEDNNPYHIDYDRQTNLFDDDNLTGI